MLVDFLESIKLSSLNIYYYKYHHKTNFTYYIKVVDETNNITYDCILLLCCPSFDAFYALLSCFSDIPLLPFIQSVESGFTVIYNITMYIYIIIHAR